MPARCSSGSGTASSPDERLEAEADALIEVVLSKNQQAVRQLKFIINPGVEADLYTAQCFEALSAGLTGAVNGAWEVPDADAGQGVQSFGDKGGLWQQRRGLAREFWADGPDPLAEANQSRRPIRAVIVRTR